MANPNFNPEFSSDSVWFGQDPTKCITDEVNNKAEINHTHDYADSVHVHMADAIQETSSHKIMTALERIKLENIAENANNYIHPTSHPVSMIEGLSSVATSGDYNDLANKPTIPAGYTHPDSHPVSMITGLSKVATSGSYNDLANKPTIPTIPASLPANGGNADTVDGKHAADFAATGHTHNYAATDHKHTEYAAASHNHNSAYAGINHNHDTKYAGVGHTHTAADVGAAAKTHTHNYASSTHTHTAGQVGAAPATHTHPLSAVVGLLDLLLTKENGDVKQSLSGKDVLATIKAAPIGVMTYYAPAKATNSPKASESWRMLSHKTGLGYGWVLAFSNFGSIYTGYLDNGTWRGWKTVWDANPEPLWKGAAYMQHTSGSDPQIVVPSKTLSECQHGWLLLWSDYDPGQGVGSGSDFVTTMIPKRAYSGQKWAGGAFYCDVPCYSGSNEDDPSTEKRVIKILKIYDDKIAGHSINKKGGRDDVVLRAVYEF